MTKDKDVLLKLTVLDLEDAQSLLSKLKRTYKLIYYSLHERKTIYSSFMHNEKLEKAEFADLEYFNLGNQVSKLFSDENKSNLPLVLYNGAYDLMYVR